MNKEFKVHMLNEICKEKARRIANEFSILIDRILEICPEGREMSIVKTKLEEACFFAKKSMASQEYNQNELEA